MATPADKVNVGDKVSLNGGFAHPSGTVGEANPSEITDIPHRGNEVKQTVEEPGPPAQIEHQGNEPVKLVPEPIVEQEAALPPPASKIDDEKEQNGMVEDPQKAQEKVDKVGSDDTKDAAENADIGEAKAGDKRKFDEAAEGEKPDEKADDDIETKKQKATNGSANGTANGTTGEVKKGRGRPKSINNGDKADVAKKEKKVPTLGKSERKTRSQGTA